jgi:hypothetical protein
MINRTLSVGACRDTGIAIIVSLVLMLLTPAANAQRPSIAAMQAQIAALEAYVNPLQTYLDVDVTTDPAKPVVRITAANLQIVSGAGATFSIPNGVGNLLVGYDEARTFGDPVCSDGFYPDESSCLSAGRVWSLVHKSGSHNVVIGQWHNYSQYAGLVAGSTNTVNGSNASVLGGFGNTASGLGSSVSGGSSNIASGSVSSVSGGNQRSATGLDDWVAGALFQDN